MSDGSGRADTDEGADCESSDETRLVSRGGFTLFLLVVVVVSLASSVLPATRPPTHLAQ